MVRTLRLVATISSLVSFAVYMPGEDGGDIWDSHNENLYFAKEVFSNSTSDIHNCIQETSQRMAGLKTLTIGYTMDNILA